MENKESGKERRNIKKKGKDRAGRIID